MEDGCYWLAFCFPVNICLFVCLACLSLPIAEHVFLC